MWKVWHSGGSRRAAAMAAVLVGTTSLAALGTLSALAGDSREVHDHQTAETGAHHAAGTAERTEGHGSGGYGAHSGWPEPMSLGGDFSLTDHTGRRVTLEDFKGRASAIYFGYTQCDDICPLIGTKLGMAVDLMGDLANKVNIALISVDDRNDGPEQLAAFVAKTHPRLIGLSGTRGEIYDVAAKFRVRRDYVVENQVVMDGEEPTEPDAHAEGGHHADAAHGDEGHGGHGAAVTQASVEAGETPNAERVPGQRIKIRSASDDATRLHNMAMAHTTHIYLLNTQGQVVRYIYPSLTPEQLAKRLTDLIEEG